MRIDILLAHLAQTHAPELVDALARVAARGWRVHRSGCVVDEYGDPVSPLDVAAVLVGQEPDHD